MPRPQRNRPDLHWYDLKTGERARKGITGAVYADIQDGSGRYERRGESPNFTAVFIDSDGTETILPKEKSQEQAQNVSKQAAYRALVSHYHESLAAGEELGVSGSASDVADIENALETITRPRKVPTGVGPRLSAAERCVIEKYAVSVVTEHFESIGYTVQDVGKYESYDLYAAKDGEVAVVEVKGTTSNGSDIVLTRNEVELHKNAHPANALAVVRNIRLSWYEDADPTPSGGILELRMPWAIDEDHLSPIAYRYSTGLQV